MDDTKDLFNDLQKAISDGDTTRVQMIQKRILLGNRDLSVDRDFIGEIIDKPLGKNIASICNGECADKSYMWHSKTLSSLITHMIIECEHGRDKNDIGLTEAYIILGKFINSNEDAINDFKEFIKERYSDFITVRY